MTFKETLLGQYTLSRKLLFLFQEIIFSFDWKRRSSRRINVLKMFLYGKNAINTFLKVQIFKKKWKKKLRSNNKYNFFFIKLSSFITLPYFRISIHVRNLFIYSYIYGSRAFSLRSIQTLTWVCKPKDIKERQLR